jgi:hypothetical protein
LWNFIELEAGGFRTIGRILVDGKVFFTIYQRRKDEGQTDEYEKEELSHFQGVGHLNSVPRVDRESPCKAR